MISIFKNMSNWDKASMDIFMEAIRENGDISTMLANTDNFAQIISNLLSHANTRKNGITILIPVIEHRNSYIEKHANVWASYVTKACNARELANYSDLIYMALKSFAEFFYYSPALSKNFISNNLPKIYESLQHVPEFGFGSTLKCIESCLRLYPGPSGPFRSTIESFLTKFIDFTDKELVNLCGKCKHLLLQVHGGGQPSSNYKARWCEFQSELLENLNQIIDAMFLNTSGNHNSANKKLPNIQNFKLNEDPVKRAVQLYTRFQNYLLYLFVALREPFPVPKPVSPSKILNLIARGLAKSYATIMKNALTENIAIGFLLPLTQSNLLELLETLIYILGNNLKIYQNSILNLFIDALKISSSKPDAMEHAAFCKLRIRTYRIIQLWCSTTQYGSLIESIAETVTKEIFNDVSPFESELNLAIFSESKKRNSKNIRRKLQNENITEHKFFKDTKAIKLYDGKYSICVAAYRCLQEVLQFTSSFLKPALIKAIQHKMVFICSQFYIPTSKSQFLYLNSSCRLEAYSTLTTLLLATHNCHPPPTQMFIQILQKGAKLDENQEVRTKVQYNLYRIEKLVHPQKEGLQFPVEINNIRNNFERHALSFLLNGDILDDQIEETNATQNINLKITENLEDNNDDEPYPMDSNTVVITASSTTEILPGPKSCIVSQPILCADYLSKHLEENTSNNLDKENSTSNGTKRSFMENSLDVVPPPSSTKIQKIELVQETDTNECNEKKQINDQSDKNEDELLAEIVAEFVDELK